MKFISLSVILLVLYFVNTAFAAPSFTIYDLQIGKVIPVHVFDYTETGDNFEWDGNYHITGISVSPSVLTSGGGAGPFDLYYNVLSFHAPIDVLTSNQSGVLGIIGILSIDPITLNYQYYSLSGYLTDEPVNGLLVTYDQFLYLWNTQALHGLPLDIAGLNQQSLDTAPFVSFAFGATVAISFALACKFGVFI